MGFEEENKKKDALKLYNSKKNIGVPQCVLYTWLTDEEKEKRIEDIRGFVELPGIWKLHVQSEELKDKIIRKCLEYNKVDKDNYFYYFSDNDFYINKQIIDIVVEQKGVLDSVFFEKLLSEKLNCYPELLMYIVDNNVKVTDINMVASLVAFCKSEEQRKHAISKMIENGCFSESEAMTRESVNNAFNSLSEDSKREIFDYIVKNKLTNKLVNIVHRFPIDCNIKFFNVGISENFCYDQYINSVKTEYLPSLYNYFCSLEEGDKYIVNETFLSALKKNLSKSQFDKIFNDRILENKKLEIITKCEMIYSVYNKKEKLEMMDKAFSVIGKDMEDYFYEMVENDNYELNINDYPHIKQYLMRDCKITNDINLDKFFQRFGGIAFFSLKKENIVEIINSNPETFNKIISLLDANNTNVNMDVVNTITNAFIQRRFRMDQGDDYNVFSKFERLLENKNSYTISEVADTLNEIGKIINIADYEKEHELLINDLFEHKDYSLKILHNITDAYITKKREMYVAKHMNSALNSLNIDKYYNKAYIKKNFIELNDEPEILLWVNKDGVSSELNEEEKRFLSNMTELREVISYKKNKNKETIPHNIVQKFKLLESVLNKYYEKKLLSLMPEPADAKYEYTVRRVDDAHLLNVLYGINVKRFDKTLGKNEEKYKKLSGFLNKYKLMGWGNIFDELGKMSDLQVDETTIWGLINYFDKIEKEFYKLPNKNQTLSALLDYANAYSSSSSKYKVLINEENYNLIAVDPGPNVSSATKGERVLEIPKYVKKMYERDTITVPSGEFEVSLGEDRTVGVSIGDIYNPMVLTYGERTGSCLRMRGMFEKLYDYCLSDKNGFHIKLFDPKTGEFVSRVSGIRNGNTIFLNELRMSVSENYNSKDLVSTIKKVSEFLVESTKNDPCPIENVVISNDYAMEEESQENLNIENREQAFNKLPFNINDQGNVLYTNSDDHKTLKPYKFGDAFVSEYKPYNSYFSLEKGERAQTSVNRIYMIDQILKNKNMDEIELLDLSGVSKCVCGHGWVIYEDQNKKVHELVIDKFKNDKQLRTLIDEKKQLYFGGVVHEVNR